MRRIILQDDNRKETDIIIFIITIFCFLPVVQQKGKRRKVNEKIIDIRAFFWMEWLLLLQEIIPEGNILTLASLLLLIIFFIKLHFFCAVPKKISSTAETTDDPNNEAIFFVIKCLHKLIKQMVNNFHL